MTPIYRIARWNQRHENRLTRRLKRLRYVPIPTAISNDEVDLYTRPNGMAMYGCFARLIRLAAQGRPRGLLARESGAPYTAEAMGRLIQMRAELVEETIAAALEIGLLEQVPPDEAVREARAISAPDVREARAISAPDVREVCAISAPDVREARAIGAPDVREVCAGPREEGEENKKRKNKVGEIREGESEGEREGREEGSTGNPGRTPKRAGLPSLPLTLATPEMTKAWQEYIVHRRQIRHPLTPLAAQKQIDQLAGMGPALGVIAINQSIRNGWTGIFPPKGAEGTPERHAMVSAQIREQVDREAEQRRAEAKRMEAQAKLEEGWVNDYVLGLTDAQLDAAKERFINTLEGPLVARVAATPARLCKALHKWLYANREGAAA